MEKLRQNCDESAEFILRFKSGDNESFEEFCRTYRTTIEKAVFGKCKFQDKEDVVQEVFLKIYKSRSSYDPAKAKITTWVCNLARNLAIDIYRKEKGRRKISPKHLQIEEDSVCIDQTKISFSTHFLSQISESDAALLRLKYMEGLTSNEIAIHVGMTKSSVVSRIHLIKTRLQDIYGTDAKTHFMD